ncbi:hypothetical protein HLH34_07000 [Gluconacetobacter azotocaptans]|uniref:Histidine kinase n=1 Tax=Gluconacetobacter azotocaptans TaxID=142834 RepID=A0A7W4JRX3_9PROT|nr:hypothetical protein [Gluconacetobacter azotocaptans]MBB2189712.1 hypothetical protein [Gluconacetobacter azotocaptans]MBM9401341.1 hypothetical protein [Gluconacetobacter azotocaptans]GBQ29960.1 hypothetical protein AA13594_1554 [Gluconacetobacter azotocaptans DSM 13594]
MTDDTESNIRARQTARVLHDVRGLLSPAVLQADKLTTHSDPQVRDAAEGILNAVEQAVQRLKDLSPRQPPD